MNQGGGRALLAQLTPNAGFHLGYGYGAGRYPNIRGFTQSGIHNIDVGLDYSRALSVSRRTQFSFATGSALFYANQGITVGADRRLDFALLGNANLTHEMGRTLDGVARVPAVGVSSTKASSSRSWRSRSAPTLQGLISRRLQFDASTAYTERCRRAPGRPTTSTR